MNARRERFIRRRFAKRAWVARAVVFVLGVASPHIADFVHMHVDLRGSGYQSLYFWPLDNVYFVAGFLLNIGFWGLVGWVTLNLRFWLSVAIAGGPVVVCSGLLTYQVCREISVDALGGLAVPIVPIGSAVVFAGSYTIAHCLDRRCARRCWIRARFGCERCGYAIRRTHAASCPECGALRDVSVFPEGGSNAPAQDAQRGISAVGERAEPL